MQHLLQARNEGQPDLKADWFVAGQFTSRNAFSMMSGKK